MLVKERQIIDAVYGCDICGTQGETGIDHITVTLIKSGYGQSSLGYDVCEECYRKLSEMFGPKSKIGIIELFNIKWIVEDGSKT